MISPEHPSARYRPSHAQGGWLRWPFAWTLALILTLGMLALLATVSRPWQASAPPPERLAVALHQTDAPAVKPAAPIAQPAAPHTAKPAPDSAVNLAPILSTPDPALQAAPVLPPSPTIAETTATPTSTNILPANQGAAPLSSQSASHANIASLPLKQRCGVQIKPVFPQRARNDDIEQGRVLARLYLEADGRVRSVQIIEATPRGYFETETRLAALQWRCLPSGQAGDSVRVSFVFGLE
ncbi:hypothetical protein GCM10027046_19040 [Uliginosibacterium flavum]|uniref:TonB family protein n=1 Tax=Uliginosibacterium flavum TaxID=1396831 RepID=A0ABV2TFN5_9RHOO